MSPDKLTEALKDLDAKVLAFESLSTRDPIEGVADDLAESVRRFLNLLDSNLKGFN